MQAKKSESIRGTWVRWSRYELFNGIVIPAEGAELKEYDPWQQFRANEGKYRTVQQPYTPFLELHRRLRTLAPPPPPPSPGDMLKSKVSEHSESEQTLGPRCDADRLVLEWCNLHGLLGLVPIMSRKLIIDEPRYRSHLRIGSKWITSGGQGSDDAIEGRVGSIYPQFNCGRDKRPEEIGLKVLNGVEQLDPTWPWVERRADIRDFFLLTRLRTADGQGFRLPCPGSRLFWDSYGEPTDAIAAYVETYATYMDQLSQEASRSGNYGLSYMAKNVERTFTLDPEGALKEEFLSAGLLASYALMFLWDRVAGRRALQCQNCGSYFVSDEDRAKYCSPTCRNTAQSRRYRARKRTGE
jgi:hypothetical protein